MVVILESDSKVAYDLLPKSLFYVDILTWCSIGRKVFINSSDPLRSLLGVALEECLSFLI